MSLQFRSHSNAKSLSEEEWEALKPTLRRLYIEEGRTENDIRLIMALIFKIRLEKGMLPYRFSRWEGFRKNNRLDQTGHPLLPTSNSSTTRNRRSNRAPDVGGFDHKFWVHLSRTACSSPRILIPNETTHAQERVLHSIDNFCHGLFESHNWQFDPFSVTAPIGVMDSRDLWASLGDTIFGAKVLVQESKSDEAWATIQGAFLCLESVAASPGPSMVIKFWKLCHYFEEICEPSGDYTLLYRFIGHYKDFLIFFHGAYYPLVPLLAALYSLDAQTLSVTLRMAYLKAIHTLKDVLSNDHSVVLSMWSNYTKQWGRGFDGAHDISLINGYQSLQEKADRTMGPYTGQAMASLHGATYAAFYNLRDFSKSKELGSELKFRSLFRISAEKSLRWGQDAQCFAFSSKVLAQVEDYLGDFAASHQHYQNAVDYLSQGDQQCVIRSQMLSTELGTCVARWNSQGFMLNL